MTYLWPNCMLISCGWLCDTPLPDKRNEFYNTSTDRMTRGTFPCQASFRRGNLRQNKTVLGLPGVSVFSQSDMLFCSGRRERASDFPVMDAYYITAKPETFGQGHFAFAKPTAWTEENEKRIKNSHLIWKLKNMREFNCFFMFLRVFLKCYGRIIQRYYS